MVSILFSYSLFFIGRENTAVDSFSHIGPLLDTRQDAPIRFKIRICIMYPYKNAPIRFEMRICMTEPYKKFKMTVKNRIFRS